MLSGVKPDEKTKFINKLQKDQNIVAMVGDGINDAAALASSHIGIALGGGVGAASEVSSIVLMRNQLSQVIVICLNFVILICLKLLNNLITILLLFSSIYCNIFLFYFIHQP